MLRLRFLLVCLVVCVCALPLRVAAGSDPLLGGEPFSIPLPAGREMSDEELLDVEGQLFWVFGVLIVAAATGAGAAGGAAIYQNWFDEDYGIDGDDWRAIGGAAIGGFCAGLTGGVASHFAM